LHEISFGERFKAFRRQKRLTQQELASFLSTSPSYISEIEKGKKMPGSDLLISLKRSFPEIDLNQLLTGERPDERLQNRESLAIDLLRAAIEVVESALKETGREMAPPQKSDLVCAIYELYADTGKQIDRQRVLRIIKSAR